MNEANFIFGKPNRAVAIDLASLGLALGLLRLGLEIVLGLVGGLVRVTDSCDVTAIASCMPACEISYPSRVFL